MDARQVHGHKDAWAALAAAVLLSALSAAAPAAQRVALVIGNSAYEHTDALRNPGNDAADMAGALKRLGFEVVEGTDLDFDGFYDKLRAFDEASRGADVTLFFYAGHGLQVQDSNWLAPVDAKLETKLDLRRGAIELDTVMESMRGTKKLVFLDACRNNPLAGELARSMGLSRAVATRRGLARVEVESGSGTLIGYATAPGDVADDGAGRNSPFTAALLEHIETPGLSANDMFSEVAESVRNATNRGQVPWMETSLGRFYLASGAPPPPKDTATAGAGGTAVPPPSGDAARAYEAAERIGTIAAFRLVVTGFPDSIYAKLAQEHIDRHGGAEPLVVAGGDSDDAVPAATPEAVEKGLGLSREDRRLVQMGLSSAGHDAGGVDGMFGGRTRRALRGWQESKEVEVTGYLTGEQWEVLLALGREEEARLRAEAERREREAEERQRAEAEERARKVLERRRAEREAREAEERRRAEAERERKAREAEERRKRARGPGTKFRDCPECPELVVVPGGTIGRAFAVGVYEVTFGEWDACVSGGGCGGYRPEDEGWGRGRRPVINVSWEDAKAYVGWLSRKTGEEYRLLSESEWEYVARAGTSTDYWWGDGIGRNRANCDGCGSRWDNWQTAPVGSFSANGFGLYDVHGNVWEWVEDCWKGNCGRRVLRGGSWNYIPSYLRSAYRYRNSSGYRNFNFGFRVARTLTP